MYECVLHLIIYTVSHRWFVCGYVFNMSECVRVFSVYESVVNVCVRFVCVCVCVRFFSLSSRGEECVYTGDLPAARRAWSSNSDFPRSLHVRSLISAA